MNPEKRVQTRKAKAKAWRKRLHEWTMGTKKRAPAYPRIYGCGPGFRKDKKMCVNMGLRRNPLPGPGKRRIVEVNLEDL